MILETSNNTLSIIDSDRGLSMVVEAFTGGHVDSGGGIVSPGPGPQQPAPKGQYYIVDNPNPVQGREDWFGLFFMDGRIDDYANVDGGVRSGIRLHGGGVSHGCVTVNNYTDQGLSNWEGIYNIIQGTSTETLDFIKGPYFWNPTGTTVLYGTLTIR